MDKKKTKERSILIKLLFVYVDLRRNKRSNLLIQNWWLITPGGTYLEPTKPNLFTTITQYKKANLQNIFSSTGMHS